MVTVHNRARMRVIPLRDDVEHSVTEVKARWSFSTRGVLRVDDRTSRTGGWTRSFQSMKGGERRAHVVSRGIPLLTADRGFSRFPGLELITVAS